MNTLANLEPRDWVRILDLLPHPLASSLLYSADTAADDPWRGRALANAAMDDTIDEEALSAVLGPFLVWVADQALDSLTGEDRTDVLTSATELAATEGDDIGTLLSIIGQRHGHDLLSDALIHVAKRDAGSIPPSVAESLWGAVAFFANIDHDDVPPIPDVIAGLPPVADRAAPLPLLRHVPPPFDGGLPTLVSTSDAPAATTRPTDVRAVKDLISWLTPHLPDDEDVQTAAFAAVTSHLADSTPPSTTAAAWADVLSQLDTTKPLPAAVTTAAAERPQELTMNRWPATLIDQLLVTATAPTLRWFHDHSGSDAADLAIALADKQPDIYADAINDPRLGAVAASIDPADLPSAPLRLATLTAVVPQVADLRTHPHADSWADVATTEAPTDHPDAPSSTRLALAWLADHGGILLATSRNDIQTAATSPWWPLDRPGDDDPGGPAAARVVVGLLTDDHDLVHDLLDDPTIPAELRDVGLRHIGWERRAINPTAAVDAVAAAVAAGESAPGSPTDRTAFTVTLAETAPQRLGEWLSLAAIPGPVASYHLADHIDDPTVAGTLLGLDLSLDERTALAADIIANPSTPDEQRVDVVRLLLNAHNLPDIDNDDATVTVAPHHAQTLHDILFDPEVATAFDEVEAALNQIALHRATDNPTGAAALLIGVIEKVLAHPDAHAALSPAALIDRLDALGGDADVVNGFRSRIADPGIPTNTGLPRPVTIVFVGGDERQSQHNEEIDEHLLEAYDGNLTVLWHHPGWESNTHKHSDRVARDLDNHPVDAIVLMQLIPTQLGRDVRRLAGDRNIPWLTCGYHSRRAMQQSIEDAARFVIDHS